jgi:hypothetical protein
MNQQQVVDTINEAINRGKVLTVPIWEGSYTPDGKFQVVEAVRYGMLKVSLLNPDENSWTKYINVTDDEFEALLLQIDPSHVEEEV